jgi:hypothetical protein
VLCGAIGIGRCLFLDSDFARLRVDLVWPYFYFYSYKKIYLIFVCNIRTAFLVLGSDIHHKHPNADWEGRLLCWGKNNLQQNNSPLLWLKKYNINVKT